MGTNAKTAHHSYTVAPSVPTSAEAAEPNPPVTEPEPDAGEWTSENETGDATGVILTKAISKLPPDQPKSFHELLFGHGKQAGPSTPSNEPPGEQTDHHDSSGVAPPTEDLPSDQPYDPATEPSSDVLTPVPETLLEGAAAGTPLLVGGADLIDSTVTLLSYSSDGGPREVLLAAVHEDAEAKVMEALALSDQKMVPVQVEQEVTGRLPLDSKQQLHELVVTAAKSVNNKLKNGQPIPEHTIGYYDKAEAAVQAVLNGDTTADEKAMAAHYMDCLDQIHQRMSDSFDLPYEQGGKIPHLGPYQHTGTAKITKYVPAPLESPEPGQLPAVLRQAGRIHAGIDPTTGVTSWDGSSRSTASGKEYLVDLGEGWSAIYRPYAANDPHKHEYSLRGQLELHAPQGPGHAKDLVRRLGQLNLVNRPLSAAEGEWTYLNNNIAAQGLADNQDVAQALTAAHASEDLQLQEVFHARQHEAIGLDQHGLHQLAREFQLEAAAACLPKKVSMVRDAVAHAAGFTDGATLAAHPGYDPTPRRSGGWLTWSRFDVTAKPQQVAQAWKGKRLVHEVGGDGNMAAMFATGVLASTERRAIMGVGSGLGKSEQEDKKSGGASSVFLRVRSSSNVYGPALVWDNPEVLIRRADYYGYNSDHFGVINPANSHSMSGLTRDPLEIAKFKGASNELMIRNGIDLLGAEAPSRIICASATEKGKLLAQFAQRGITHLGNKPISEVVI